MIENSESRRARAAKTVFAREMYVAAIAIVLLCALSWGLYAKSQAVSALQPVVTNMEEQIAAYIDEVATLQGLLAGLEEKMVKDEEQSKALINALRQEIAVLQKRATTAVPKINTDKIAYLTFDDGPLAAVSQILDVLKEYNVKATFFVNGRDYDYALRMYKRMVAEGHAIGNHTYSHEYDKIYSSVSGFVAEVEQLQDLITQTTGVTPEILRFPGGSDNKMSFTYSGKDLMPTLTRVVQAMGMQYFDWNVSSASASTLATAESVYESVINGCKGKNVVNILFHETNVVAEALPAIIEELTEQGYTFASLTKSSYSIQFLR